MSMLMFMGPATPHHTKPSLGAVAGAYSRLMGQHGLLSNSLSLAPIAPAFIDNGHQPVLLSLGGILSSA